MKRLLQYRQINNWNSLQYTVWLLGSSAFVLVLAITYFFRINYSPWYDEAALIDNVANADVSQLKKGLDWLQTIPLGYFYFARLVIEHTWGIQILRIISIIFFVSGVVLAAKFLLLRSSTRWIFAFITLLNPISLTYATMAKPYAIEFFLGISATILFKRDKRNTLFLLGVLSPFFSNTVSFLFLALSLVWFFHRRKIIYPLLLGVGVTMSNVITLFFTAAGTRVLMKQAWFGDVAAPGLNSLKSAIGNLGWLPVSGLGLIPGRSGELKHFIPSILILCIILILIVRNDRELVLIVILVFILFSIAQGLLIVPAAGRLMLSTAGLVWLLLVSRLDKLNVTSRIVAYSTLIMVVVISSTSSGVALNPSGISNIKEALTDISNGWEDVNIFTDVGAGPAAHFYLQKHDKNFTKEIIWVDSQGGLSSCFPTTLKPKDRVILDGVSEMQVQGLLSDGSLSVLGNTKKSYVFRVEQIILLTINSSSGDQLFCKYTWSNPSHPTERTAT